MLAQIDPIKLRTLYMYGWPNLFLFCFAKKQRTKVENYLARTYSTSYTLNSAPSAAEHNIKYVLDS